MSAAPKKTVSIEEVSPDQLDAWISRGGVRVIDVREPAEHAREHVPGAKLAPEGRDVEPGGAPAVFYCRSGVRSRSAAERFAERGERAHHLSGGIEAWKRAGKPVIVSPEAPMAIMRQVQVVAGSLIVLGVALGVFVSAWWLALSAFVGCGLMFAGLTGWCGMAKLLGAMPWNQRSSDRSGRGTVEPAS